MPAGDPGAGRGNRRPAGATWDRLRHIAGRRRPDCLRLGDHPVAGRCNRGGYAGHAARGRAVQHQHGRPRVRRRRAPDRPRRVCGSGITEGPRRRRRRHSDLDARLRARVRAEDPLASSGFRGESGHRLGAPVPASAAGRQRRKVGHRVPARTAAAYRHGLHPHHGADPGARPAQPLLTGGHSARWQPGAGAAEGHRCARGRGDDRTAGLSGVAQDRRSGRHPRLRLRILAGPHAGRSRYMRNVAIVGAGMTPFAEHFELGIKDLVPMAYAEAVANVDKGIQKSEIEAAWFGELSTTDGFPSGILADPLDLTDIPVTRIENACATGNDAIRNGTLAIASGLYDVVLVVGADKVRETSSNTTFWDWAAMTRDNAWDYPLGLVAPANFALHVIRYLHESPATKEHMAMVAVKNHFHAVNNPKAQLRYEITVEQALAAPIVVEPFGLYDCTPQSDGAAAVILAAEEVVDRYTDRPVWVRGVGLGMDRVMHQHKRDMTTFPPTVRAAKAAMAMAGLTPRDVDVAGVHDCFTGVELISYEDLGFVERFEAYKLVESREHYVGGSMPINPSGGLKAKGHPPGATGVAQCYELFNQLRGEAENQVDGARVALAHNIGGPAAVSAVTVLSNEKN